MRSMPSLRSHWSIASTNDRAQAAYFSHNRHHTHSRAFFANWQVRKASSSMFSQLLEKWHKLLWSRFGSFVILECQASLMHMHIISVFIVVSYNVSFELWQCGMNSTSRRLVTYSPVLRAVPCQTQPSLVASTGAPSAPSSSVLEAESRVEKTGSVHTTYMDKYYI